MASPSEILGLFTSPQQYQQQQQDLARARAMEYAKLDPFQQANTAIGEGAYGLAGAIGGALGGVDPQLQIIAKRQALISMLKQNDPESYATVADLATKNNDPQFGFLLSQEGRKLEESLAGTNLKKAQAAKAEAWKQTQTDSAAKRQAISTLEEKLATDPTYKPTPQELASARWIIANETKPKSMIDPTTNQLLVIEGLDVNSAAPNLAAYLKKAGIVAPATQPTEGVIATDAITTPVTTPSTPTATQIAPGIKAIETPASKIKAQEEADKQAAKLEEDTRAAESINNTLANIKGVRTLITDTKNLIKPTTTGLTGKILSLGSTEARVLENNNSRIKANAVFEELANLKSQSKTGATGFGALNLEELKTIQNKAATLDPVSPNYAKDLADIDDYFARIEKMTMARTGRAEEKVKNRQSSNASTKSASSNDESKIQRFIDFNGGKPTRQQAIDALRKSGVIQ